MAGKIRIAYFLEDIAHEQFIRALVMRIACESGLDRENLEESVLNSSGGSVVLQELRRFLMDIQSANTNPYQIMIVAKDSNCAKYIKARDDIMTVIRKANYHSSVVLAIPNPYIERWYVIDPEAFKSATGARMVSRMPRKHRQRESYKKILRDALITAGIRPILGGAEYGGEIAKQIDLYKAGKSDRSFGRFATDLKREVRKLATAIDS